MSASQWHYMATDKSVGPFSEEQMRALAESTTLSPDTPIRKEGSDKWQPMREVFSLQENLPSHMQEEEESTHAWTPTPAHPWRRYFARIVDTSINAASFFFCFGFALVLISPDAANSFFTLFSGRGGAIFDLIMTTFVATFITAALIGFSAGSIGKWLFGIRITDKQNRPIGYKLALKREMMVWLRGMALGIPIIALFTLISAYKKLKKDGATTWDEQLDCVVTYRPNGTKQIILSSIGFILFLVLLAATRLSY